MNVRITHKIAASYVLMVVFIIVVGSGGFLGQPLDFARILQCHRQCHS